MRKGTRDPFLRQGPPLTYQSEATRSYFAPKPPSSSARTEQAASMTQGGPYRSRTAGENYSYAAPQQATQSARTTAVRGLGALSDNVAINYAGAVGAVDAWDADIARVGGAIDSLFGDIHTHIGTIYGRDGEDFTRNYIAFHGAWHAWLRDHDDGWELAVDHLNVRRSLLGFIRQYNAYERTYTQLTGRRPSNPGDGPEGGGLPSWGWALIVIGGVAVGGYALYSLARLLREGRLIGEAL